MARVTVEDCLEMVENRFYLVHLTAKRVRQMRRGAKTTVKRNNTDIVLALREIASGIVTPDNVYDFEPTEQEEIDHIERLEALSNIEDI